jgi:hypothetical protein
MLTLSLSKRKNPFSRAWHTSSGSIGFASMSQKAVTLSVSRHARHPLVAHNLILVAPSVKHPVEETTGLQPDCYE